MTVPPNNVVMSVFRESWPANSTIKVKSGCTAICLQSGELRYKGGVHQATSGIWLEAGDQITANSAVKLIRFTITPSSNNAGTAASKTDQATKKQKKMQEIPTPILSSPISTVLDNAIMRLDQVDFPPGAVAYRHTHPGAGIRYLVHGSLHIEADHTQQQMEQGQAWFEAADSPVRATAGSNAPACFIRLMLLPPEYEGQPTLNTLDPEDATRPRLQTNTRYFDHRVALSHLS